MMEPPLPKPNANPTAQKTTAQMEKFITTLATTVPTFFCREKPISRKANPACMNMTRIAATTTHTVSSATVLRQGLEPEPLLATGVEIGLHLELDVESDGGHGTGEDDRVLGELRR